MAYFDPAFEYMLPNEGGFQKRASDPGNWAGGELKGTKFGISAASYPELDIENLTIDQAKAIYLRDWWNVEKYAELVMQPIASKIFDMAVNFGRSGGHKIVQRALIDCAHPVVVDGRFGMLTLAACNSISSGELMESLCMRSEERYRDIVRANPARGDELPGWLIRARKVPA